jgi:integrase
MFVIFLAFGENAMSRTKLSGLGTRSDRLSLKPRNAPYWLVMEKGRALGYRKGTNGGTWVARFHDPSAPRLFKPLGSADDITDADGVMVLSCAQAQEKAREWFRTAYFQVTGERVQVGVYTVKQAVDDYLEDRERHGMATVDRVRQDFAAHVLPSLGREDVARLTRKKIEEWMKLVSESGLRRRGKARAVPVTPDQKRSRKATANRMWNNLRAALNFAFTEKHVQTDAGWADVRAFRGTQVARILFLSVAEQVRLVNVCPADFRLLVQAGLFTGAREAELTRLVAHDFDPENGSIFIEFTKTRKSRHVTLTTEGQAFFKALTAGLEPTAPLFRRKEYDRKDKRNSGEWTRPEMTRMMRTVCDAAKVPRMVFHSLRHTYASTLVNAGVPLVFVAQQLGHANTREVEKHYGHLCKTAKADAVRRLTPDLGIFKPGNVVALEVQPAGAK